MAQGPGTGVTMTTVAWRVGDGGDRAAGAVRTRALSRGTRGAGGEEDAGGGEAEPVRVRGRARAAVVVDGGGAGEIGRAHV